MKSLLYSTNGRFDPKIRVLFGYENTSRSLIQKFARVAKDTNRDINISMKGIRKAITGL